VPLFGLFTDLLNKLSDGNFLYLRLVPDEFRSDKFNCGGE
jgi:hypothetical protein